MSENSFLLKIYSPSGLVLEEGVASVTLPSAGGEIGIFPLHARYIGTLGTGILSFETTGGDSGKVVISGGFARMKESGELHVLTDYVVFADDAAAMFVEGEREKIERFIETADTNTPEYLSAHQNLLRLRAVEDLKRA